MNARRLPDLRSICGPAADMEEGAHQTGIGVEGRKVER
jgi:hypothetical protein